MQLPSENPNVIKAAMLQQENLPSAKARAPKKDVEIEIAPTKVPALV